MSPIYVVREIPPECIEGLKNGSLVERSGAIYEKGAGIVKHLQFAGPDAAQQVSQSLSGLPGVQSAVSGLAALAQISVALKGINIAVTAVGFVVVCRKLNAISKRLDELHEKVDRVLQNQLRSNWQHEMERRARLAAAVENLARGLRIDRHALTDDGLARLGESSRYYWAATMGLLSNARAAYEDPESFAETHRMALTCDFACYQALGNMGHIDEAARVVESMSQNQNTIHETLMKPLEHQPIWLGQLEDRPRARMRDCIAEQGQLSLAIDYATHQCAAARALGFTFGELSEEAAATGLAVIDMQRRGGDAWTTRTRRKTGADRKRGIRQ